MTAPRVAYVNLGCRVNRDELDDIARTLAAEGVAVVDPPDASVIVVNSCAVTGEAQATTRKRVRRLAALPQAPEVVVSGCVASLFADELASVAPNVRVVPDKAQVAAQVMSVVGTSALPHESAAPRPGTPTGRTRPGIKIQDGCDHRCSYCIVWRARGAQRSLPAADVLERVARESERGAAEVVLSGINLGSYQDRGLDLAGLLAMLMRETDVRRVRIGSIEPMDVSARLVETLGAYPERLAPFLHVCLQSGCDATLARMGRPYDVAAYARMAHMARAAVPSLALGTDVIAGFPGETEAEFQQSLSFCRDMAFANMHVFRYSPRPLTPAADAPDQVSAQDKAARSARLRALARDLRREAARARLGTEELVVVESRGRGVTGGLFDVRVSPAAQVGSMVRARLTSLLDDGSLLAELL